MTPGASLILVCGLPGTGKTTVAEAIAKKTKSYLLSTDVMRKEIVEKPEYNKKEKEMVYGLIFSMAERMLQNSKNVVLDGTFYKKELRDKVREIADATKSKFQIVEVVCNDKIIRERLERRRKACSASDADFAVYKKIKKVFEPIREKHSIIDTGKEWKKKVDLLFGKIK